MSDIPEEKIERISEKMREDNIKFIRLQFVDINGTVKNIVIPFNGKDDMSELFNEGMLFDGSSIAGFVGINDSELAVNQGSSDVHVIQKTMEVIEYLPVVPVIQVIDG